LTGWGGVWADGLMLRLLPGFPSRSLGTSGRREPAVKPREPAASRSLGNGGITSLETGVNWGNWRKIRGKARSFARSQAPAWERSPEAPASRAQGHDRLAPIRPRPGQRISRASSHFSGERHKLDLNSSRRYTNSFGKRSKKLSNSSSWERASCLAASRSTAMSS